MYNTNMLNENVPGPTTPKEVQVNWKPRRPKTDYGNKQYDTAIFLSAYFGLYGIDQLYLGNIARGLLKLLTAGGLGIIYFSDFIKILDGEMQDKNGKHLRYERRIAYYENAMTSRVALFLGMVLYLPVIVILIFFK